MTRSQRISKLANAIRAFRGQTWSAPGAHKVVWKHYPQKDKELIIKVYLRSLGLDVILTFQRILAFKTVQECDEWLKTL